MAFVDNEIKKEKCTPMTKNPLIKCRIKEMYQALKGVEFSLAGAKCMQVVINEICEFCKKENGR